SYRMEETELVVNVESAEDAALVESAGATAEIGEAEPLWNPEGRTFEPAGDIHDGQGWGWVNGAFLQQCSVGFTGYVVATGAPQFATAGHCTENMFGNARTFNQTAAGQPGTVGGTIGTEVGGAEMWGSGFDVSRVTA